MLIYVLILLSGSAISSVIRDCIGVCFVMMLLVDGFVESATISAIDAVKRKGLSELLIISS